MKKPYLKRDEKFKCEYPESDLIFANEDGLEEELDRLCSACFTYPRNEFSWLCDKCLTTYTSKEYHRYKLRAIHLMGGGCIECGFSDWRALQIDHIDGTGYKDKRGTLDLYLAIIRGERENLQLLCANCNWIKRIENEEHQGRG